LQANRFLSTRKLSKLSPFEFLFPDPYIPKYSL
jgi:hypothetical protein